jgi:hypothetical protein
MPREMGELRRLCLEWNRLVDVARERGIRSPEGRRYRYRRHFHMDRDDARARVARLREMLAPFFSPITSTSSLALDAAAHDESFGVELEFLMPPGYRYDPGRERIAQAIRDAGVMCMMERYNHITRTHWKITTDNSLGYARGAELASPPLRGEAGLESIRKVCKVITDLGCKVSVRCGLHVHVGVAGRGVPFLKNLVMMYHHFEGAIDTFMAPSRRGPNGGGGFCGSLVVRKPELIAANTVAAVGSATSQDFRQGTRSYHRYRKLNVLTFNDPGTVEFRHHQGTVDGMKTEMWVRLCLRMTARADERSCIGDLETTSNDSDAFFGFVKASEAERIFFRERIDYFNRQVQRRRAA